MLNVDRTEVDADGKPLKWWYWWGDAEELKKVEDFQSYKEGEDLKNSGSSQRKFMKTEPI
jgi:hypothetical protein